MDSFNQGDLEDVADEDVDDTLDCFNIYSNKNYNFNTFGNDRELRGQSSYGGQSSYAMADEEQWRYYHSGELEKDQSNDKALLAYNKATNDRNQLQYSTYMSQIMFQKMVNNITTGNNVSLCFDLEDMLIRGTTDNCTPTKDTPINPRVLDMVANLMKVALLNNKSINFIMTTVAFGANAHLIRLRELVFQQLMEDKNFLTQYDQIHKKEFDEEGLNGAMQLNTDLDYLNFAALSNEYKEQFELQQINKKVNKKDDTERKFEQTYMKQFLLCMIIGKVAGINVLGELSQGKLIDRRTHLDEGGLFKDGALQKNNAMVINSYYIAMKKCGIIDSIITEPTVEEVLNKGDITGINEDLLQQMSQRIRPSELELLRQELERTFSTLWDNDSRNAVGDYSGSNKNLNINGFYTPSLESEINIAYNKASQNKRQMDCIATLAKGEISKCEDDFKLLKIGKFKDIKMQTLLDNNNVNVRQFVLKLMIRYNIHNIFPASDETLYEVLKKGITGYVYNREIVMQDPNIFSTKDSANILSATKDYNSSLKIFTHVSYLHSNKD